MGFHADAMILAGQSGKSLAEVKKLLRKNQAQIELTMAERGLPYIGAATLVCFEAAGAPPVKETPPPVPPPAPIDDTPRVSEEVAIEGEQPEEPSSTGEAQPEESEESVENSEGEPELQEVDDEGEGELEEDPEAESKSWWPWKNKSDE